MSKPTPRPWEFRQDPENGIFIIALQTALYEETEMVASDVATEENAHHIVHCVNMYEELIEVLSAAFHCIEDEPHRPNVADNAVTPEQTLVLIKNVIKKARAGE